MVALPIIPLAGEVLTWLGIGAAATATGVGTATILDRNKKAEEAQSSALGKVDVATQSKEKCKDCPPTAGFLSHPNHSMSDASRAYQARVTGYAPGTEWNYMGREFDGFHADRCLLQEAKALFTNFFDDRELKPKTFYVLSGKYDKLIEQATAQHGIVMKSPPAALDWYFMEETMYLCMKREFRTLGLYRINSFYKP
ncbi:Tox-REase-5 domain-containing protein [Herbaspirillum sp. YR522]|uniref:Tox-REase-5 domain-containing protein n=1 Tax=Herbaspirillum sp. YR522 TaxID=1144342 RepID=UPI00026F5CB2|nr:Tox-REase-5 domain-containing protein [Herbaspirillum sp. YR522]EJN01735.1 hypothetical protein PMI40_03222 [Herbaspirillum sp. YR522]